MQILVFFRSEFRGSNRPQAFQPVSASLAQIGEFSFILAGLGVSLGLLPQEGMSLILAGALIFAGALGNIIDSAFYGIIFEHSYNQVAAIFPEAGGYSSFLHGKVVDMLYFPLYEGFLPSWIPIWGGEYFIFFRPVFNVADSAITIGVVCILLFQRDIFKEEGKRTPPQTPAGRDS